MDAEVVYGSENERESRTQRRVKGAAAPQPGGLGVGSPQEQAGVWGAAAPQGPFKGPPESPFQWVQNVYEMVSQVVPVWCRF